MTLSTSCLLVCTLMTSVPEVAVIVTPPESETSTLHFVRVGETEWSPAVAQLTHIRSAEVKSVVLPGTRTVLAIVQLFQAQDESWASGLVRLLANEAPVMLADRVYHASRPLVSNEGRVFVQRGRAGPPPSMEEALSGHLRVDNLTIEEINPRTGEATTLYSTQGYLAHLAGVYRDEVLIYRVAFQQAQLLAVNMNTQAIRVLISSMVPMARDFQVDAKRGLLRMTQANLSSRQWEIQELQLEQKELRTVATGRHVALLPSSWPKETFVYNPNENGWELPNRRRLSPFGAGIDEVRAFSADENWVAAIHTYADGSRFAFVAETQSPQHTAWSLPTSPSSRIDLAGFIEGVSR